MVAPAWTLTVAQVTSVEVASAGVPRSWGHWRSTSRPIAVLWSLRPLLCDDGVGGVRFGLQARWRRRRAAKERLIATLLVGGGVADCEADSKPTLDTSLIESNEIIS